jgi:hypothetical protein
VRAVEGKQEPAETKQLWPKGVSEVREANGWKLAHAEGEKVRKLMENSRVMSRREGITQKREPVRITDARVSPFEPIDSTEIEVPLDRKLRVFGQSRFGILIKFCYWVLILQIKNGRGFLTPGPANTEFRDFFRGQ